jgi:anti-anti-sigma factor
MEIQKVQQAELVELWLKGRLDAEWSEFVASAIDEVIRAGCHHVELHMGSVHYISSAGIRVLVKHHRALHGIRGSLSVVSPSEQVDGILRMVGLANIVKQARQAATPVAPAATVREVHDGAVVLEVQPSSGATAMRVSVHGAPERVLLGGASAADCRTLQFPAETWGLGIGAMGSDYADCESRFGEFFALGGAAATLAPDGSQVPDYVLAAGSLQPTVQALTAIRGTGRFQDHGRFRASAESGGLALSKLLESFARQCSAPTFAVALAAETGCIVGAQLTRSPALLGGSSLFEFPAVRDRMSFTTERGTERSTALLCGIVTREPSAPLRAHVRPVAEGSSLHAHIHALVLPYRPVQQGALDLGTTVRQFLESALPTSLLHLMADDRPYEGIGQTELFRGAYWLSPVERIEEGLP